MKLHTIFEVIIFIVFKDVFEGTTNFLMVTWPGMRLPVFGKKLHADFVGIAQVKLYTKFEISGFTSYAHMLEDMANF